MNSVNMLLYLGTKWTLVFCWHLCWSRRFFRICSLEEKVACKGLWVHFERWSYGFDITCSYKRVWHITILLYNKLKFKQYHISSELIFLRYSKRFRFQIGCISGSSVWDVWTTLWYIYVCVCYELHATCLFSFKNLIQTCHSNSILYWCTCPEICILNTNLYGTSTCLFTCMHIDHACI